MIHIVLKFFDYQTENFGFVLFHLIKKSLYRKCKPENLSVSKRILYLARQITFIFAHSTVMFIEYLYTDFAISTALNYEL